MTRIYRYFCLIILLCSVQTVSANNRCEVNYVISSDWGNGFTANVNVINQGDAWAGWNATWTMPSGQQITGLWNGQHSQIEANVSVDHYDWNANIASNASVNFGFNGSYSGENTLPNDFRINGVLCSGQAPLVDNDTSTPDDTTTTGTDSTDNDNTATIEPKSCRVNYTVSSQWNTGFTGNVSIENTGIALNGWNVTWDMPNEQSITSLWNGVYQQTEQAVQVSHLSWNQNIIAGATISFGFNASHLGTNQIPGNVAVDGVLCEGQTPPEVLTDAVICTAKYTITEQWNTGFSGDVVIENQGTALHDWQVTWTMPAAQTVSQSWNGEFSQSGDAVTVNAADWNKIIPSGEGLAFGFNGTHKGENPIPIDIQVNGTRCTGQADQILIRPQAPTNLQVNLHENNTARLIWDDNSDNEAQFRIERRKTNQNWQVLIQTAANTNNYSDTSLLLGQAYEYRISATNSTGVSAYSNTVLIQRQDHSQIAVQTLIENCYICHNTEGASQGDAIPTIAGLQKSYIVSTMTAYQIGTKTSTIMSRIAKGYSSSQIDAIATELAAKTYTGVEQQGDAVLVALGRKIHDENCTVCHTDNGRASTTGSPLAGQWKPYLIATLDDFIAGNNSSLPQAMINQLSALSSQYGTEAVAAIAEFYAANPDNNTGYSRDNDAGGSNTDDGDTDTGDSGNSGDSDNTLTAPIGISATVLDNEAVAITWLDQSSNETGFKVERSGINNVWQVIANLAANSSNYKDSNVSVDNNYLYRVGVYAAETINYSETASSTLLTTIAYGQRVYSSQGCASCHGEMGLGGFTNVPLTRFTASDLSRLTEINAITMPRTEPSNCIGNCAAASAQYIIEVLAANSSNDAGSNTTQACSGSSPASPRSLRLLTRYEYQNTVNDLLGLSVNLIHELPDENRVAGFDNNSEANQVTALRLEAFLNKSEALAQQAVSQNFNSLVPCNTEGTQCAQRFIESLGKRAYRRPLSTTEQAAYLAFFAQDSFNAAVEKSIMTFLMSPHFLYRSELGSLQADGSYLLTAYEIASQLSYLFWGSMPDAELMQLADGNTLNSDAERITQAARLFNHPRSREALGNFAGQWLLGSSPYSLAEKDQATYPNYTANVRETFSQELVNFFNHVTFDSSQKYRELFTQDYILANNVLANYYGLSAVSGTNFTVTPILDGTRTGILSLGAVLAKYATSNSSHPFKRGAFFMERLLCHDLPEPANMGVVIAPVPDPNATTRELFSFHSESNTACYSCHQYLDGPGFAFENYDGAGQFRTTENNQVINPAGILRGLETYTSTEELAFTNLAQLGGILAESPNASQCLARQYYRYTMGREENSADDCVLQDYLNNYQVSDYNLQTMLLGIVNSPNFTKRRAQ